MPPLRVRAARAVAVAVLLQALFVFFFLVPGHDPEPNGLPVAVVGGWVASAPSDDFSAVHVPSVAEAEALIRDREVYGAFAGDTTLVATAASVPVAQILTGVGEAAGATEVRDVVPLPADDPRGLTFNLLVLPLVITSILAALAANGLVPDIDWRRRLGLAALAGLLGAAGAVAIASGWLGALGGPWVAEIGVIAIAVTAIAIASAGIIRLIGLPGTPLPFLLFLMLGVPASGLGSAPELLPTPWAELGQFLPPGALGSALRGTAYFDGAGVVGPLAVLVAWGLVGLALNVIADRRRPQPG